MNLSLPNPAIRNLAWSARRSGVRRIVGAGHKMYLSFQETQVWLRELRRRESELGNVGVFVLPTFTAIAEARSILAESNILYGAQDTYWEERGPFTGEVSPLVLKELGCSLVEIGHAERRAMFGEDNDRVARKVAAVLRNGMAPVLCVGEARDQSEEMAISEVVNQVRAGLGAAVLELADAEGEPPAAPIIVAYEPVWAIGARAGAPTSRVGAVANAIRGTLSDLWRGDSAVIYGGSVTPVDATGLLDGGVDGLFVGRASLDLDEFIRIVRAADRPV